MTQDNIFEEYFFKTLDWYEKRNIDVMVHGSTLLNILREGDVSPRLRVTASETEAKVVTDKEINLYILAEDFTDEIYRQLHSDHPYFKPIEGALSCPGIYYGDMEDRFGSQWALEPGFVYLNKLWKGKTTRFKYQGKDNCVLIPDKYVSDKKKWSDLLYKGRTIKVPANTTAYLTYYYGNWEREDLEWHWSQSPYLIKFNELEARGEFKGGGLC